MIKPCQCGKPAIIYIGRRPVCPACAARLKHPGFKLVR